MAGNTLPRDVGRSFQNADLAIEATEATDTRYIAMEVSFTADLRDCNRAIWNAELIESFTGKPAQPAIASVRNDRAAAETVESRAVCTGPAGEPDIESGVAPKRSATEGRGFNSRHKDHHNATPEGAVEMSVTTAHDVIASTS